MKAVFTNTGAVPLPIASAQKPPWVNSLDTGIPYTVDSADHTIVTVGDEPTLREGLEQFFEDVAELLKKLVTFWKQRHDAEVNGEGDLVVKLSIVNQGENALRVILGDPKEDRTLEPGASGDYSAPLYIEVRELGV